MSTATVFTLQAAGIGSAVVGGMRSQKISLGLVQNTEASSGLPRATHAHTESLKPTVEFGTTALAQALTALTALGVDISGLSGGLKLYGQLFARGATRIAGSTHVRYTINDGILIPTTISCSHQKDAMLTCRGVVVSDGVNDPVVKETSQALATGVTDERFSICPATVGAIEFTQLKQISVDFGLDVLSEDSDGEVYPTFACIKTIMPKITLTGTNHAWFGAATVPLLGKSFTQANTNIYFRKRLHGSSYVPDATAQHIKINAAGLATVTDVQDATSNEPAQVTVELNVTYDGTNECLKLNLASAIT
jgi:hypothetical protein